MARRIIFPARGAVEIVPFDLPVPMAGQVSVRTLYSLMSIGTETTILQSYGSVVRYLNRVGLAARDPFDCPMVNQFRRV